MKRIIVKIKAKKELFIGIIIGGIVVSLVGVVGTIAANTIASNYVLYNSSTGKTNVKEAIDELYDMASTHCPEGYECNKIPTYFAFGTPTTSSTQDYRTLGKNVFLSLQKGQKSVCIVRNNKLNCFKHNNFNVEKDHVQQVFSDISCTLDSNVSVRCVASDFDCTVNTYGRVYCYDESDSSSCNVNSDGSDWCW